MNKLGIYALLAENGVWHEITEHKAVFNMAELAEVEIPYPEGDAKNLFLRDDKKRSYYLPIIPRRCDHFRIRMSGQGECRLYSLVREVYTGSPN